MTRIRRAEDRAAPFRGIAFEVDLVAFDGFFGANIAHPSGARCLSHLPLVAMLADEFFQFRRHLGGNLSFQASRIETCNPTNPALARQQVPPSRLQVQPESRHDVHSGDDNLTRHDGMRTYKK